MDNTLAKILIERKFLKEEMEVTAHYLGSDLSGTNRVNVTCNFFIQRIQTAIDGRLIFYLRSTKDGTLKKVYADSIEQIEGMPPSRFCACYNISINGSQLSNKKKRGRKSTKNKLLMNENQNGE